MSGSDRWLGAARSLLALDGRRIRARIRRPSAGGTIALGLPVLLVAGAAWAARASLAPEVAGRGDAAALGMLLAAPLAFLAYGALFGGADAPFLRRLGLDPRAMYLERVGRLLLAGLGLALAATVLAWSSGGPVGPVLGVSLAAVTVAWGIGVAATTLAARAMALRAPGRGWGLLTLGMWDRDMAAAAPLVYAPLAPLLAGALAGAWAWPGGTAGVLPALVAAAALAAVGARWWAAAVPRFAPRVLEMAFDPPPPAGEGELRVGRGLARLLPRPAAAVWARDAAVARRRFAWSTRIVWPVAILALVVLARWGDDPVTRGWVGAGAVSVWILQTVAMVGLGQYERGGRRWLDRALGVTPAQRLLGRWAWGWGSALWLGVPLAVAWAWWTDAGPGWPWLLVGAGTAAVGATASVAVAGWR